MPQPFSLPTNQHLKKTRGESFRSPRSAAWTSPASAERPLSGCSEEGGQDLRQRPRVQSAPCEQASGRAWVGGLCAALSPGLPPPRPRCEVVGLPSTQPRDCWTQVQGSGLHSLPWTAPAWGGDGQPGYLSGAVTSSPGLQPVPVAGASPWVRPLASQQEALLRSAWPQQPPVPLASLLSRVLALSSPLLP